MYYNNIGFIEILRKSKRIVSIVSSAHMEFTLFTTINFILSLFKIGKQE